MLKNITILNNNSLPGAPLSTKSSTASNRRSPGLGHPVDEGWREKQRKRSSRRFGGGGAEFIQFLAALAVLSQSIWQKRFNSTVSFNSTYSK